MLMRSMAYGWNFKIISDLNSSLINWIRLKITKYYSLLSEENVQNVIKRRSWFITNDTTVPKKKLGLTEEDRPKFDRGGFYLTMFNKLLVNKQIVLLICTDRSFFK